ncbi:hypothetical protein ACFOVU_15240 [Nocardiopsis sediminis]|uniref:Uncharacterized protein n=1 Tax=Nocardiopsis sediminis TaxID=1778267 RepID=A0ABV8FM89_9ACTN
MSFDEPARDVIDRSKASSADHGHRNEPPVDLKQEVLKGLGGPSGMVYSALPVVVFAAAVPFISLTVAIGAAVALALADSTTGSRSPTR